MGVENDSDSENEDELESENDDELEDDEESSEENESEDEDEGSEDENDDDADLVDEIVSRMEERLSERFDSIADRRVNALLKEIRKQDGGEPKGQSQSSSDSKGDRGDVRAARLAAREYLSDEIDRFVSADERKLAMDLVSLEVDAAVSRGDDDEDEIGRDVADRVAKRIKDARKMYGDQTRRNLKRQGALKDQKGQPKKGGGGVSQQSEFAKGAEIARRIRPQEQST